MMKAQARIAAASAGQSDFCTSHTASGKVAAPAIEPIEICRVHATTPTNTMTSAAIAHGVRHRNAPTKLATALPPANPQKSGVRVPRHPLNRRGANRERAAATPLREPDRQVALAD